MPSCPVSVGREASAGIPRQLGRVAEPAPPLRSANPWQGAQRAPGLHLLRPEAGNARPTALTRSGSVDYRVVSQAPHQICILPSNEPQAGLRETEQRKSLGQRQRKAGRGLEAMASVAFPPLLTARHTQLLPAPQRGCPVPVAFTRGWGPQMEGLSISLCSHPSHKSGNHSKALVEGALQGRLTLE